MDEEKVNFKKILGELKQKLSSEDFDKDNFDRRLDFLRVIVEKSKNENTHPIDKKYIQEEKSLNNVNSQKSKKNIRLEVNDSKSNEKLRTRKFRKSVKNIDKNAPEIAKKIFRYHLQRFVKSKETLIQAYFLTHH